MAKQYCNTMGLYFSEDQAAFQVTKAVEEGILSNKYSGLDFNLLKQARFDVDLERKRLDRLAPRFAQYLLSLTFGKNTPTRAMMLLDATFYGAAKERMNIGVDLGVNPFKLYKKVSGENIDDTLTRESLNRFTEENLEYLANRGFENIGITSSSFFWMREEDVKLFMRDETLRMPEIVPFLSGVTDNINFQKAYIPTLDEFMEMRFDFVSCRQKGRPQEKIMRYAERSPNYEMKDWLGYRVVLQDREHIDEFLNLLVNQGKRSIFKPEVIKINNYYDKPSEKQQFKGIHGYTIVLEVYSISPAKERPVIVELQLIDAKNYYNREISKDSPSRRRRYEDEKQRMLDLMNPVCRKYKQEVLDKVFGEDTLIKLF